MRRLYLTAKEFMSLEDEVAVRRAQIKSLTKQFPLLYFALFLNATVLGWMHVGRAPWWLTLPLPLAMAPLCLVRSIAWLRMPVASLDGEAVTHLLRRSIFYVAVLAVIFTCWSHALLHYGNIFEQTLVLFFMATTGVGCIFCLVQLRPAVALVTLIVVAPVLVRLFMTGNGTLVAIGVNLLNVTMVLVFIVSAYYQDFRREVLTALEVERLGEEHRRAAQSDALTGLANRRRFFQDLDGALADGVEPRPAFALGLIDLDGFKPINDLYGHATGDHVLTEIGRRLIETAGADATVARLGGDEFGILVRGEALARIECFGAEICARLSRPIPLPNSGGTVQVGASIGFASFPDTAGTKELLLERADFALYQAKIQRRGTAIAFSPAHASTISDRRKIERALQSSDLEAELSLVFQPIVLSSTGRIVGFEALARWTNAELGPVSPADFIPAAERLGLVRSLTEILFRQACATARTWPSDVALSFNLSTHDLAGNDPVERLTALVRSGGLPFDRIIFEITETAFMTDFQSGCAVLQALRDLGCSIALDDFGTGYSSLSYVHRLPLNKLKIDQSFVRSLGTDPTSLAIVQSICNLSDILGMQCVVEGVETAEHVAILRSIGCTMMQGYHFGRPMTALASLAALAGRMPAEDGRPAPAPCLDRAVAA